MSDIVLGRPPEALAILDAPKASEGALLLQWPVTSFTPEFVGLFRAGDWLANLTQANAGLVLAITEDEKLLSVAVEAPKDSKWEADDSYCLQRQEEIWHFSKRLAVDEVRDKEDWVFGWTPESLWGVTDRPASKDPAVIEAMMSQVGARDIYASAAKRGMFDVQVRIADGAIMDVHASGDTVRPWGLSDVKPPWRVEQRELSVEEAAELVSKSVVAGSDGVKVMPWPTA